MTSPDPEMQSKFSGYPLWSVGKLGNSSASTETEFPSNMQENTRLGFSECKSTTSTVGLELASFLNVDSSWKRVSKEYARAPRCAREPVLNIVDKVTRSVHDTTSRVLILFVLREYSKDDRCKSTSAVSRMHTPRTGLKIFSSNFWSVLLHSTNAIYRDARFVHHAVFICKFYKQWAVISLNALGNLAGFIFVAPNHRLLHRSVTHRNEGTQELHHRRRVW